MCSDGEKRISNKYLGPGRSPFLIQYFLSQHTEVDFGRHVVSSLNFLTVESGVDSASLITLKRIRPRFNKIRTQFNDLISLPKVAFGEAVSNLIVQPETRPNMNGEELTNIFSFQLF